MVNIRTMGENNGNAKLTEKDVIVIRNEHATHKVSTRALAKLYGVGQTTIQKIVTGKAWTFLPTIETKVERAVVCDKETPVDIRLLSKVTFPKNSECWEYNGSITPGGYPQIEVNGKTMIATRVAYETWIGPIGKGLFVCHRCDNRKCIYPFHLFLGTHQDNMDDMTNKHRQSVGERQHCAKLTDEIVRTARREYKEKITSAKDLATRYGVNDRTMYRALTGETWGHIKEYL